MTTENKQQQIEQILKRIEVFILQNQDFIDTVDKETNGAITRKVQELEDDYIVPPGEGAVVNEEDYKEYIKSAEEIEKIVKDFERYLHELVASKKFEEFEVELPWVKANNTINSETLKAITGGDTTTPEDIIGDDSWDSFKESIKGNSFVPPKIHKYTPSLFVRTVNMTYKIFSTGLSVLGTYQVTYLLSSAFRYNCIDGTENTTLMRVVYPILGVNYLKMLSDSGFPLKIELGDLGNFGISNNFKNPITILWNTVVFASAMVAIFYIIPTQYA